MLVFLFPSRYFFTKFTFFFLFSLGWVGKLLVGGLVALFYPLSFSLPLSTSTRQNSEIEKAIDGVSNG